MCNFHIAVEYNTEAIVTSSKKGICYPFPTRTVRCSADVEVWDGPKAIALDLAVFSSRQALSLQSHTASAVCSSRTRSSSSFSLGTCTYICKLSAYKMCLTCSWPSTSCMSFMQRQNKMGRSTDTNYIFVYFIILYSRRSVNSEMVNS